jgi:hypothetical protein
MIQRNRLLPMVAVLATMVAFPGPAAAQDEYASDAARLVTALSDRCGRRWDRSGSRSISRDDYSRKVLPELQSLKLQRIMMAIGLTKRPCSLIRQGKVVPHPRHSVITFQWLGTTNYELAPRNTIVLLDAYYDRGAPQQVNSCSSRKYGRTFKWGRES